MDELYKIIIADDEFIIRDGLKCFNWGLCGFTVTASVSNGKKVLQIMEVNHADVIITDIKMPIMDGLELSKILNSKYPNSKIVILTGFKDFDYAKTAIASGVSEYLLKPVDLDELELLFHRLKEELDSERRTILTVNNYKKQLSGILPIAIEDFLREIVDGKINDSFEIEEKLNLLELSLCQPYYACTIFHINLIGASEQNDVVQVSATNIYEPLKKYLELSSKGYFYFNHNPFEVVAVLNYSLPSENNSSYDYLEIIVGEIKVIIAENIGNLEASFAIGIGNIYTDIFSISTSHIQASKAIKSKFFDEGCEIFPAWKNKSIFMNVINEYPYAKENILLNAIWDSDKNQIGIYLNDFWNEFNISVRHIDPIVIQNMILQFLNMLDRKLNRLGMSLENIMNIEPPFIHFIKSIDTLSSLKINLEKIVFKVYETFYEINNSIKTSSHSAIQQAMKYIQEHYTEKITLNQVAEMVYLNPSYFSIQFKKETGTNFVEFLKECRIEKAKELLKRNDLKVYEIGEIVGYQNPKYFTDMFKAFTGLTPLEYRQKLIL